MKNVELEEVRATLTDEEIETVDAKVGEKRAKNRKRIFDRELAQELKDLDLTPEEYEEIFGF